MTTIITVKGKKFNVEEVAAKALEIAKTIKTAGTRSIEIAAKTSDPAGAERKMILEQAIRRAFCGAWAPMWERIDENNLVESIIKANGNRVNGIRRGFGK